MANNVERLSVWLSVHSSSIDVSRVGGVKRSTTAGTMAAVIAEMAPEDLAVLVAFCGAVVACASGDCSKLGGVI